MIKSKNLKLIYIVLLLINIPIVVYAQQTQDIINQQDWITRNQQNRLEDDKRIKEQNAIKKDRELKQREKEELERQRLEEEKLKPTKKPQCFNIREIKLNGATLISKSAQKKILKPFANQCFDEKKFAEITLAISDYYKNKGYVTVQVTVPKQNIQDGDLELQITEGKIEEIIVGNNNFTDKMQEFTAFGNLEGEYLDINDINQGIYQINRLPSNHAILKIEPGILDGQSKVLIDNQKTSRARATIGYDNLGNKFTGVKRSNFSGAIDNLFFLNDGLNLSYNTNLNDDNHQKDIKSFSSSFSVPFRYYTFSFDYSKSDFAGTNPGINGDLKLTGYSDRKSFTLDRVLLNQGNFRLSTAASLTEKESASYLNYEKIDTSERKLTIANFSLSISNYFENGINLYLKPSYSKGLKLLNAKKDEADSNAATPKAQFDLIKLYAAISKRFIISKINAPVTLGTEMDSQISKDTLFGTEQFAVGGYYSVRGFRENYIVGDSGYYFRNKATFNIGSLILPFLNNKENHGYLAHLNKFKIEPFYDYGHVHNRYNDSGGRLAGAGVKTIFESRYFNASLTYSAATNRSNLVTSNIKENKLIYFEISASCC